MTPRFYFSLLIFFLWLMVKFVYDLLRKLTWRFNGIHGQLLKNYKPIIKCEIGNQQRQPVENAAQVETILLKYTTDSMNHPAGLNAFITYHSGFVSTEYILKRNVTLYSVDETKAVFVETDENVDVYDLEIGGAFSVCMQYTHAKKVITLPLHKFIAFGKELGKPNDELIFVSFTARCGSSLLMQLLHATKKCTAIAEPTVLQVVQELRGKVNDSLIPDIMQAVINTLCKPRLHKSQDNGSEKTNHTFILKLPVPGVGNLPLMNTLYPKAKNLFMYRKGIDVIKSYAGLWHMIPFVWVLKWSGYYVDDVRKSLLDGFAINEEMMSPKEVLSFHEIALMVWASHVRFYQKQKDQLNMHAIRYEDMISDRVYAIRRVFELLSLDYDSDVVQSVFSKDSQRGSPLAKAEIVKYKPLILPSLTGEEMQSKFKKMCTRFEVPSPMEELLLPGTITHRKY